MSHSRELAAAIRQFREEVRAAIVDGGLKREQVANIDETAVRFFASMVKTLHYLGARSVPGTKAENDQTCVTIASLARVASLSACP